MAIMLNCKNKNWKGNRNYLKIQNTTKKVAVSKQNI